MPNICGPLSRALDSGFGQSNNGHEWAWKKEHDRFFASTNVLRGDSSFTEQQDALEKHFNNSPDLVRHLIHRPGDLLTAIQGWDDKNDFRQWWVFTSYIEALWTFIHSDQPNADNYRHLSSQPARTRFLTLSAPFRDPVNKQWKADGVMTRLFGKSVDQSVVHLIRRARAARDIWRDRLANYQDFPSFNAADPHAIEAELNLLVFADGRSTTLKLIDHGQAAAPQDPDSNAILEGVVERHLLPRFALWRVWRTVLIRASTNKLGPYLLYILITLSTIASIVLVSLPWNPWTDHKYFTPTVVAAAATYVVIGVGTLCFGRLWAMPLLLRQPAAAAFGLVALVALPILLENSVSYWRELSALFLIASFGYLLIECRNHNPGQLTKPIWRTISRLVGRPLAVLWIGIVHSFLVASIGLATIIPAATTSNSELRRLLTAGTTTEQLAILLVATLWCLTVGVFSQILWQDQPITAPLAHRRWRSER